MSDTLFGQENLDPMFYIIFYTLIFISGLCIGSFLNVVICRLPNGESLITNSSHCVRCNAKIKRYDLIPLFSWIFLRGKCRSCKAKISARYPVVELLNALIYIITFMVMDFNINSILTCIFFSVLITIGFIDFDTLEINISLLIAVGLVAAASALFTDSLSISQRITGSLIISVPFFLIGEISGAIIKHRTGEKVRGIELGDTFLMLGSGFFIGTKAVLISAFFGIIIAAFGGMIQKRSSGESKFAFGPYLAMGLFIGTLWGVKIADTYLSQFT